MPLTNVPVLYQILYIPDMDPFKRAGPQQHAQPVALVSPGYRQLGGSQNTEHRLVFHLETQFFSSHRY